MDYQKASNYWIEKDKTSKKMDDDQLLKMIEEFIKKHNTLALATGYGNEVRCTPIEYMYVGGYFYIFSEGGLKFKYLENNKNVSASIFEPYTTFSEIHSVQITGEIEVIEDDETIKKILELKGINPAALDKIKMSLHLLRLRAYKYEFLDSSVKLFGYSNRQTYIYVKK